MKLVRVEIADDGDVTFFFDDSPEPFSTREFEDGTPTRRGLQNIESAIYWFNERQRRGVKGRPLELD